MEQILGLWFVIILGGSVSIVTNNEPNTNVQFNETVGGIANKTIVDLLKLNWIKEENKEKIKMFFFLIKHLQTFMFSIISVLTMKNKLLSWDPTTRVGIAACCLW